VSLSSQQKGTIMLADGGNAWFIGCACDRKFVLHTAAMLTSLDINGGVPEATIIVAAFDLDEDDKDILRVGAGGTGRRIRFIDVDREMLNAVAHHSFRSAYPMPVLGRLLIPGSIKEQGARLLTLDSDMIVNKSVRSLFELNMHDMFVGAIHDVPRIEDYDYFNSGMMLIEVDAFNGHDIGPRAIQWLAEQTSHPTFPDQDALNSVVGHKWYRLDRKWNWYYNGPDRGDLPLSLDHYEAANIAHFTAGKPWDYYYHPGRPLYERYRAKLDERMALHQVRQNHVDQNFVMTAREVLLGIEPEDLPAPMLGLSAEQTLRSIVQSRAFAFDTLIPLRLNTPFTAPAFHGVPNIRHRSWCADRLPLRWNTRERIVRAGTWRELLTMVIEDERFRDQLSIDILCRVVEAMPEQIKASAIRPGQDKAVVIAEKPDQQQILANAAVNDKLPERSIEQKSASSI
jgi:lipopolysaccharide biosynthesis glycosyltransferase